MSTEIRIVPKGITEFTADCIVNAANEYLAEGGGVCGAIFRAAGSAELTRACQALKGCRTGNAKVTPAFRLKAKYIIHAVGPIYKNGRRGEAKLLYDCYIQSLSLVAAQRCHSVVFPLISAGIFGYPKAEAWRIALQACADFEKKIPDYELHIMFAVLSEEMLTLGERTLKEVIGRDNCREEYTVLSEDTKAAFEEQRIWGIPLGN